jgi:protein-S-isoprenylcysteine O-methyltransferase Ste14
MSIKKKQLAIVMIICGTILIPITTIYLIFQSNQWVQNNVHWFVFASGIIILTLGIVVLLSTKQNNPTNKDDNANNPRSPNST